MFGVSAKLRAMVGLQSADSIWKALIKQFDHVVAIPIFCQSLLGIVMMGGSWTRWGLGLLL